MDVDKYNDSKLIADEIASIIDKDTKRVNEDKLIEILEKDNSNLNNVFKNLLNIERVDTICDKVNKSDKSANVKNLISSIKQKQSEVSRKRNKAIIITLTQVSVAVCLLVAFIAYNLNNKDIEYQESLTNYNSSTNIDAPVLILNNGEKIALNETITAIENIEINDKSLSYNKKDNFSEKKDVVDIHTLIVPAKMNYSITLSDGTVVTLNSCSRLIYPKSFENSGSRYVELEGEAYFNVSKSDIPFIIKSKDVYIKVYGTELNVNNYDSLKTETLLVKGVIGVTIKDNDEVILSPNQLHIYNANTLESTVENVDVNYYTYWINNDFMYKNIELKKVLTDFERWYGVKFNYDKNVINDICVSINCLKSNSIENVLHSLQETTDLIFINNGGGEYDIIKRKK